MPRTFSTRKALLLPSGILLLVSTPLLGQAPPPQPPLPPLPRIEVLRPAHNLANLSSRPAPAAGAVRGAEIVEHAGFPELHVDGAPFFVHGASFFYDRIPRDLWETSLERHAELGINTIHLSIPWNWHEPRPGELDFDGHTHPRRDLRALLQMISALGFKLMVSPGTGLGPTWRDGGFPEWTPREAAARRVETMRWLSAVALELAPYSANRKLRAKIWNERHTEKVDTEIGGPLIFVELNSRDCPDSEQQAAFAAARVGTIFFCGGPGGDTPSSAAGSRVGRMEEWFLAPQLGPGTPGVTEQFLEPQDLSELAFRAGTVAAQAQLPPGLIRFQAGWHAPEDDVQAPESAPANTLLASRLLLGHGVSILNFFPLQDSYAAAGFEAPGVNRHVRWDAALDLAGCRQPRARAIVRNGSLLETWGTFLASAHLRADFGLLVMPGDAGKRAAMQIARVAQLAGYTPALLPLDRLTAGQLLRHALILLPVSDPAASLPDETQHTLSDFVQQGGMLAIFPARPRGSILDELWKDAPARKGKVIELGKDFHSWVALEETFAASRARPEATAAIAALEGLLQSAGVRPVIKMRAASSGNEPVLTQLASNEGTGRFGERTSGAGLVSVTNLNYEAAAEETLQILSSRSGARGRAEDTIALPVTVPPHESLLLPLHFPLCAAAKAREACSDEVVAAGAELLWAERDGKALELTFYAPAKATVLLRLARQPGRVTLDEMHLEAVWSAEKKQLEAQILRGPSPDFLRVLRIPLPYTPSVPEKPDPSKRGRRDWEYEIVGGVRLPLGERSSLPVWPPLALLNQEREGRLAVQATNYDEVGRDVSVKVEGAIRGSGWIGLDGGETKQAEIRLKDSKSPAGATNGAPPAGVLRSELELRSGRDRRTSDASFVVIGDAGATGYQYDFDRDGASEWVLESKSLRLIVSPESGGRALAFVEKESGINLFTAVGGLRDALFTADAAAPPAGMALAPALACRADWKTESNDTALHLTCDAPNRLPPSAQIEKTVRLTAPDRVQVDYAVHAAGAAPQEFQTAVSIPVQAGAGRATQFCWEVPAPDRNGSATRKCEAFVPGGEAFDVPPGITRIEVRTPSRIGVAVEWTAGRMRIERKLFSAMLKLQQALSPEQNWTAFRIQFTLLPPE